MPQGRGLVPALSVASLEFREPCGQALNFFLQARHVVACRYIELFKSGRNRIPAASGEIVWIRNNVNPEFRDGIFAGATGTLTDITKYKNAEDEMNRVLARYNMQQKILSQVSVSPDLVSGRVQVEP